MNMKNKLLLILFLLFISICLDSCAQKEIEMKDATTRVASRPVVIPIPNNEDGHLLKAIRDSDPIFLLMNATVVIDGKFVLSLSKDAAISLGISEQQFDMYCEYIQNVE